MTRLRAIFVLLCSLTLPCALLAQKIPTLEIEPFPGEGMLEQDLTTGLITFTNGVLVKCGGPVLTADRVTADEQTLEVIADGSVHIQQENVTWTGDHVRFNFKTGQIEPEQFRMGK